MLAAVNLPASEPRRIPAARFERSFAGEITAVQPSPGDKPPRRAVPESAEQHREHEVVRELKAICP
jgi:hypothetical protein